MAGMMSWLAGMGAVAAVKIGPSPAASADADAAQADARHLRELYGVRAEAWCEAALRALPAGDARRPSIRRIAKALHGVPLAPIDKHTDKH